MSSNPPKESALYAKIKKEVSDHCERIKLQRIDPWRVLGVGKTLDIKTYYGKRIHYSGVTFDG